ncbi:permease [Escherichia coli]|nr:permease [Escherichia coli]
MQDARAYYYSGISYLIGGNKKMAKKAFKACLMWCNEKEKYTTYKEKIKKLLGNTE